MSLRFKFNSGVKGLSEEEMSFIGRVTLAEGLRRLQEKQRNDQEVKKIINFFVRSLEKNKRRGSQRLIDVFHNLHYKQKSSFLQIVKTLYQEEVRHKNKNRH